MSTIERTTKVHLVIHLTNGALIWRTSDNKSGSDPVFTDGRFDAIKYREAFARIQNITNAATVEWLEK